MSWRLLRQLLQETSGRVEQGCGTISDAYIHYYYKLEVTYSQLRSCLDPRGARGALTTIKYQIHDRDNYSSNDSISNLQYKESMTSKIYSIDKNVTISSFAYDVYVNNNTTKNY